MRIKWPMIGTGLTAIGLLIAGTGYWLRNWEDQRSPGPPTLDAVGVVDLGSLERGALADARFSVRNSGDRELVLDQFHTDCTCEGVDYEVDGTFFSLGELRLRAGELATVRYRSVIKSPANIPFRSIIRCRTNDPACPEMSFLVLIPRVVGGLSASPSHFSLGVLEQGQPVVCTAELFDTSVPPRLVESVVSDAPERITAAWRPVKTASAPLSDGRRLIGTLHFTVSTESVGEINTRIRYTMTKSPVTPEPLEIVGRVAAPAEIMPQDLYFPRLSGGGRVYTGDCLVRSASGTEFDLSLADCPCGVSVVIAAPTGGAYRRVTFTIDPSRCERKAIVRLIAKVANKLQALEVVVHCDSSGGTS